MLNRMRSCLAPPVFPDRAKTQQAAWLHTVLLIMLLLASLGFVVVVAFGERIGMLIVLVATMYHIVLLLILRWGYVRAASVALVAELLATVTVAAYTSSGINAGVTSAYFLILPIAALLLGEISALVSAGLGVLAMWSLFYVDPVPDLFGKTLVMSLVLSAAAVVVGLIIQGLNRALDQARRDEQTLAASNRELEAEISERRRAEDALRRERDLVARIMETSPAGITVMDRRGQIVFANLRAQDVLGLKRDEITARTFDAPALKEHALQLQARNEELDAFAHTVAHDLKSPLGLVVGFAETLAETCETLPAEDLRHHLDTIARNGRKIDAIIDALLLLASVRQREDVQSEALDMAGIVKDALERLAQLVEERQVEFVLPDHFPVVLGYGPWVEEVWVNYLSNAIKYGGQPPRVELGYSKSQIASCKSQFSFWVRDNGPGLSQAEQRRLFRPFERLGQEHAKGYGLGLSIVRRIVEKLGGQVGVESQPSQGGLFWFSLPAACVDQDRDGAAIS